MVVALVCVGTCVFAKPHHHRNEGLELANGIVDLVCKVLRPAPVVVPPPAPVVVTPAPVVVAPPPRYNHPAPPRYKRPVPPKGGRPRR